MTTPTLPTGGNRAAEAAAKARESRQNSSYGTWDHFSLAAPEKGEVYGESEVVRFHTDEPDWVEGKVHAFIPTKNRPTDYPADRKWRANADATCRYTPVEGGSLYNDCFICDHIRVTKNGKDNQKPFAATRLWAGGVIRKPVVGTKAHVEAGLIKPHKIGSPVWYEDEMVEREIDGKQVLMPHYVLFNFGMKNFFDKLLGYAQVYGTVVDRDYKITRKGAGTETDYSIVALDPQKDVETGEDFDLRDPDIAARYTLPFNLQEIVLDRATNEYYEWFFDHRVISSYEERFGKKDNTNSPATGKFDKSEKTTTATQTQDDAATEAEAQRVIQGMRDRMKSAKVPA